MKAPRRCSPVMNSGPKRLAASYGARQAIIDNDLRIVPSATTPASSALACRTAVSRVAPIISVGIKAKAKVYCAATMLHRTGSPLTTLPISRPVRSSANPREPDWCQIARRSNIEPAPGEIEKPLPRRKARHSP